MEILSRSKLRQCRNKVMPDGLTDQFRERIMALRSSVKTDYLKSQIFSKFVSPETDPPLTRRTRAINKWLATEMENRSTNERLLITPGDYQILPRVTFQRFVEHVQRLIVETIGDTPSLDSLIGSFSGGASTSRTRTESHPASKYLGKAHVTEKCLEELCPLIGDQMPLWLTSYAPTLVPVRGNVLFTVPKKTDIDRCACKEPDINMFIQKGLGAEMRRCLRRKGIDLNDQSKNRKLAQVGSLTGQLATLDLSSASDSVSTELVRLLIPACWFTILDAARCHVTVIDGDEHVNEMFSSMGNGFTFELESLLFWSIAKAACYFTGTRGVVSVYGDDIICPTLVACDLEWVLSFFGFSVNTEKSFWSGPFRESCGGHYNDGLDITPFYVKKPLTNMVDVIDVANKLRAWAEIHPSLQILDPEVEELWLWLKSFVPSRLWGGVDTSFKYQLVSCDTPSRRLQPETKRRDTGTGGYLHWHNATWDRKILGEGVQTSSFQRTMTFYRERKVRDTTETRTPSQFIHELR